MRRNLAGARRGLDRQTAAHDRDRVDQRPEMCGESRSVSGGRKKTNEKKSNIKLCCVCASGERAVAGEDEGEPYPQAPMRLQTAIVWASIRAADR
jgi:hypothetical protein